MAATPRRAERWTSGTSVGHEGAMCQKSEQLELTLEARGEAPQGQRSGEYHIVSSTDQLEAVHKLAALHGQVVDEPRRVVAIGEADSRRTRTEPAQSGSSRGARRAQPDAPQYRRVASPSTPSWNQIAGWLREIDGLRRFFDGWAA